MKKNFLISLSAILLLTLIIAGCQKELKVVNTESQPLSAKPDNAGGCRMTMFHFYDAVHDYHQIDRFTYKNGLMDEWDISYGWVAKMEYDANGRMKIAREYNGGILLYTVNFIWENNKVVKEIWYQGNTNIVDDTVTNTYNQRGRMIKNESKNYDYYVLYNYEVTGQLKKWDLFFQGSLYLRAEYTSNQHYLNPFRSARGLEYVFAYSNSGAFSDNFWPSSESWIFYDEEGNPIVYYDTDPKKTVWHPGQQNYPLQADYTDALSGGQIFHFFEYENCGGNNSSSSRTTTQPAATGGAKLSPMIFLNRHSTKSIKEQLQELRNQFKNRR